MGLFDSWFKKPQEALAAKQDQAIIRRFYSKYPEPPYIGPDRNRDWIERAEMFPVTALVQKRMMVRFDDGLLPGHVYMLYWLNRHTNKKVPAYFEFKYGVNFEKEIAFLHENGFLNEENKPTEKGTVAINAHQDVIEKHSQKTDRSVAGISEVILRNRDQMLRNGFKHYTVIANRTACPACKALDGKHFRLSELTIGVNAPPMHDGCACSIAAWEDDAEYDAWLNFVSHGGTTKEWEQRNKRR